ncbi:zinc finger protein 391-like isoform X17 [Athalia rosae]|uniref:zinc finger protein 391-like isoform X17 n=1 Tax=Athalia rosae TaxID=37344 RepID=UPI0020345CAA|nr:zinc finger protein 391-like isoform X17 [Athalia rosae]
MSSLDYLDLCRLCLVKDGVSVPIFEGEGDVRQIFLKIAACLPVKVAREDKLPKKICDNCVYKVELLYQFWNTTANAEKQLLQWLGEVGLEDKQGYVTGVLNTSTMKEEDDASSVIQSSIATTTPQSGIGIGVIDNIGLGMPFSGTTHQQQLPPTIPINQPIHQALPGPSNQPAPDQLSQTQGNATTRPQDEEEESSEEEDNSDDDCDADDGLPVKEESEEDLGNSRNIEPTTFVNVSLACDEAGPSGLQQQKNTTEIPELSMPQTLNESDAKSGNELWRSTGIKQTIHECRKCDAGFFHMTKLIEHLKNVHGIERAFKCDQCGKAFRSSVNIKRHKLIHTGLKRFSCDICTYTCNQKTNLEYHRRRHTKDFQFKCEICNKGYLSKADYLEHKNVHSGKKPYACELCPKSYPYKNNLLVHKRLHHPGLLKTVDIHNCTMCSSSFPYKRFLTRHMKSVHGIEPSSLKKFLCDYCGKQLSSQSILLTHRRTHTGEKPACCDVCGKRFTTRENLKLHQRTHTGERPHVCQQCGRAFTQRSSLVFHMRYHSGQRPYQCPVCKKAFVSNTLLTKHKKSHMVA